MYRSLDYTELSGGYVLVDVRSPEEYAEFTIPGAVNIPLFDNEERKIIGTVYNHESVEKAKSLGISYASKRLPELYESFRGLKDKYADICIFCERGGMRSSSLCALFDSIGFRVQKLRGGYKGYRSVVNGLLPKYNEAVRYIVVHGHTGAGKTELLGMLEKSGCDVLDLEKAANHRGSLLGDVGLGSQASQKQFEARVFDSLRAAKSGFVFVEAESSRIGNIVVPHYIMQRMKAGKHILLEAGVDTRVRRITDEYVQGENAKEQIISSLEKLSKHISRENIERYKQLVMEDRYGEAAEELIVRYYDPLYSKEEKGYDFDLVVDGNDLEAACVCIKQWMQGLE